MSRLSDPSLQRLMRRGGGDDGRSGSVRAVGRRRPAVTELAPGVPIVWNREPNLRSEDVKGVLDPDLAAWDLSFTSLRAP